MTTVVYLAFALCLCSAVARLSLMRWRSWVGCALLLFAFAHLVLPYAIGSSSLEVERYLSSDIAREYVAIGVTVECIWVVVWALGERSMPSSTRRRWPQLYRSVQAVWRWIGAHYLPWLLLPTLFYIETQALYTLPGWDFRNTAHIVGGGAVLFSLVAPWLLRMLLPYRGARRELSLLLSLLLCATVLFSTMSKVMLFAPSPVASPRWIEVLLYVGGTLLVIGAGIAWRTRRRYRCE